MSWVRYGHKNSRDPYWLPAEAFRLAYSYALMYGVWAREYSGLEDEMKRPGGVSYDGTPGGGGAASRTEGLAVRMAALSEKMEKVERALDKAGGTLVHWLKIGVTGERVSYEQLRARGMPCGRGLYYEMRRRFYWYLSMEI